MLEIIKKDITTASKGVLLNGVNCQRVMGSGVAKAYFSKWPQVRDQYMLWDKRKMNLGKFDPVEIEPDTLYVGNCWTQEFYGSDGKEYADYNAIMSAVSAASIFAYDKKLDIYTPWIGCGLGGLEQKEVHRILDFISGYSKVNIMVCEL